MMAKSTGAVISLTAVVALNFGMAHADETQADEKHSHEDHTSSAGTHEAHVHGAWELFAALDDNELSITITGPLVDAVGFEHQPTDETEYAAIKTLKDRLDTPQTMFTLDARAACRITQPVEIHLPEGFEQNSAEESSTGESSHAHHEEHAQHSQDDHEHNEHHEDHKDKGDHKHSGHDIHGNNVEATYFFNCQSPTRLKAITATGFDEFPAIETIDAVFLGNNKQKASQLTRQSKSLPVD